jgi:NAD(P)-dependent dehydrogenase (short-subunit alcohol dehydrogenase family)
MRSNSTAVVTGGGRGIGQAISVELARHGADIVVADLDEDGMEETKSLVEAEGQRALGLYTDLKRLESVQSTIETAHEEFETIDALVNNAGIAGPTSPCEEISVAAWDETVEVNLRGPFLACKEVIPVMKSQEYGRIVNVASVTGKRPLDQRTPYAATKMGLIGFTRTLASEVGEYNINVNAICPGSVNGPRIKRVFEKKAESTGQTYENVLRAAESESARGELVERGDVAELATFLCSSDADRITGQDINVSAGKVMY